MSIVESVEALTDIVMQQARIIKKLHNLLSQHDAITAFDDEIEKLNQKAQAYTNDPGD